MKALQGATRQAFLGFFASHILATTLVDGQIIMPHFYPPALRDFFAWYVATFKDPLLSPPSPLWLQAMVCAELCFQLPFFFVACYYLTRSNQNGDYPDWFRYACLSYGAHTATTMLPILTVLVTHDAYDTIYERCGILAVYGPYLAFPVWIWYLALTSSSSSSKSKVA